MDLPWLQNNGNQSGGDSQSLAAILKLLQNQQQVQSTQITPAQPNGGIGDIIKYIAGAHSNFQGMNTQPQQQSVNQLNNYADAITNSDNPLYQKIYGQEKQSGQDDLARTIFELSNQNRKLSQLGRTPLFSPERGGEQQFRALTQGYSDVQDNARARARSIIGAGANMTNNALSAQNDLSAMKQKNQQSKLAGIGNIADVLPSLLKLMG